MKSNGIKIYWLTTVMAAIALGLWSVAFAQKPAPPFQVVQLSKYDFSDTVELLKGAIEAQNLMVIKEIDAQKMLRLVDVQTKGMKQILFFHPRYMKRIMKANPNATIEPPLKIVVMEKPDGKVAIKYKSPSYLFGQYAGLEVIGAELDNLVAKIVEETRK